MARFVFIIGIPQAGSCLVTSEKDAFASREEAERRLEEYKVEGLNFLRIFTLVLKEVVIGAVEVEGHTHVA